MNWKRSAIGVGIALPAVALLMFGLSRDPGGILITAKPDGPAPDFALPMLDGEPPDTVRLSDIYNDGVVVLNFWASWCLECRVEHEDLSATATEFSDDGVRFFGVLHRDSPENGRAWIREMGGQTYPSLVDLRSRTGIDYAVTAVPETFIIKDGKVIHKLWGAMTSDSLRTLITPLLDSSRTAAGPAAPQ